MTETPWNTFNEMWPKLFTQGQHVTVIGPTGSGKTLLCKELVKPRGHVVATGVKHRDESLADLMKGEWIRVSQWKDKAKSAQRVVLWPKESNIHRVKSVT